MINNNIVPGFLDEKDDSLIINLEAVETVPGCMIVNLSGYVDTYNTAYFGRQMEKIIVAGFSKIIFNCTNINYISSTGISAFSDLSERVKQNSGKIILSCLQAKVREVFQLLGFMDYFSFEETVEAAVACFTTKVASISVFPKVIACPMCSHKLKATKSGRFRCPGCKSIIAIDDNGDVVLG